MLALSDLTRRSFVYRKLAAQGASFADLGGGAVAMDFGDPAGEAETARRMGLCDLSLLPRVGFKGPGTAEWLAGQGVSLPEANWAIRQNSGVLALRLAATELMLLSGFDGDDAALDALEGAWQAAGVPPKSPRGYPVPRSQTHFWFLVTGARTSEMFAKICGVDLRLAKFENGRIAQTSAARMNATLVRDDQGTTPAFQVLADSASAEFLWGSLLDAMEEFDGAPIGLTAARGLANS